MTRQQNAASIYAGPFPAVLHRDHLYCLVRRKPASSALLPLVLAGTLRMFDQQRGNDLDFAQTRGVRLQLEAICAGEAVT